MPQNFNQGQFPNQGPFPNQGQFPNQGPFPNQGQFPNQSPFPNQVPFPNQGQYSTQTTHRQRRPPHISSPLGWSIFSLFFCLPFGIISVIYASKVNALVAEGQYAKAQQAASTAWIWFWVSVGVDIFMGFLSCSGFWDDFMQGFMEGLEESNPGYNSGYNPGYDYKFDYQLRPCLKLNQERSL